MGHFRSEEQHGVHIIRCPVRIEENDLRQLEINIKSWLMVPLDIHVFDFSTVVQLDPTTYRLFVLFSNLLKSNKKSLFVWRMAADIAVQLKDAGLSSVFVAIDAIPKAAVPQSLNRSGKS